jgi:hypothetical protein
MLPKLVARAIIFLITFVAIARLIEFSHLASISVESHVNEGNLAAADAPRAAAVLEFVIAGVIALLVATSAMGGWLADQLVKGWNVLVAKAKGAYAQDKADAGPDDPLIKYLEGIEQRLSTLEQPRIEVLSDSVTSPVDPGTQAQIDELKAEIEKLKAVPVRTPRSRSAAKQ